MATGTAAGARAAVKATGAGRGGGPLSPPRASALVASAVVLGLAAQAWAAAPTMVAVEMANKPDGSQVMRLNRAEVPTGGVTFKVRNASADTVHEFLVVRTNLPPDRFPMSGDGSRVDEKRLRGIKELGDLEPGKSGALTMTLKPGHYVLFCNEPGHFKAGMYAELVVTR